MGVSFLHNDISLQRLWSSTTLLTFPPLSSAWFWENVDFGGPLQTLPFQLYLGLLIRSENFTMLSPGSCDPKGFNQSPREGIPVAHPPPEGGTTVHVFQKKYSPGLSGINCGKNLLTCSICTKQSE